eukprot:CAMPEP_0198200288 /NCGR_PEP_ID=MMETSP1445-20131203/3326_2 /TAXON_ID=36898 /ORGANISM="Pyramimonas sp., Strain CCMP2087" /LENGTH=148 /DNA_ID=CAMNT_0043870303 /DNA_START=831 /DNA_END=1277 /DNA_ORIENTATION=-
MPVSSCSSRMHAAASSSPSSTPPCGICHATRSCLPPLAYCLASSTLGRSALRATSTSLLAFTTHTPTHRRYVGPGSDPLPLPLPLRLPPLALTIGAHRSVEREGERSGNGDAPSLHTPSRRLGRLSNMACDLNGDGLGMRDAVCAAMA